MSNVFATTLPHQKERSFPLVHFVIGILILSAILFFTKKVFSAPQIADSFTGSSVSTSTWIIASSTPGNVSQNGTLNIIGNNAWGSNGVRSTSTFDRTSNDISISATITTSNCTSTSTANIGYGDFNVLANPGDSYVFSNDSTGASLYLYHNGAIATSSPLSGFICNAGVAFKVLLIVKQAGGAEIYINGASSPNATIASGTFTNKPFYLQNYSTSTASFDDVAVYSAFEKPDAPTNVVATAGDAQASVSFDVPVAQGGTPITNYTVNSSAGGRVSGTTSPIVMTGLTNDTSYTFTVSATNALGTGSSSSPSASVTPFHATTSPSSPLNLYAFPGNGSTTLFWSTPLSDGGTEITDYFIEYKLSDAVSWSTWSHTQSTSTTVLVTGLTNGLLYNFRVSAINSIGTSTTGNTYSTMPNTVWLSDMFIGTVIQTSLWNTTQSTQDNIFQSDGITITGNDAWGTNVLSSVSTFDRSNGDITLNIRVVPTNCSSIASGIFGYGVADVLSTPSESYMFSLSNGVPTFSYYSNGTLIATTGVSGYTCSPRMAFTARMVIKQAGGADLYLNGDSLPGASLAQGVFTNGKFFLQQYSSNMSTFFDNASVTSLLVPVVPTSPSSGGGSGSNTVGGGASYFLYPLSTVGVQAQVPDQQPTGYAQYSATRMNPYPSQQQVTAQMNSIYFDTDMGLGAENEQVRIIQEFLIAHGFLASGKNNGYMGFQTRDALLRYQISLNVFPATGHFGPATRSALNSYFSGKTRASGQGPTVAGASTENFPRDLYLGLEGDDVKTLQEYLNTKGYFVEKEGPGATGQESSFFGLSTKKALILFQLGNGISPAWGYFGEASKALLLKLMGS